MSNLLRKARVKPARETNQKESQDIQAYLTRSVPDKHKIATERVLKGQLPKSAAIRIKCMQCTNYQREEVTNCTVVTCALFPVRPYQSRNNDNSAVENDEDGED